MSNKQARYFYPRAFLEKHMDKQAFADLLAKAEESDRNNAAHCASFMQKAKAAELRAYAETLVPGEWNTPIDLLAILREKALGNGHTRMNLAVGSGAYVRMLTGAHLASWFDPCQNAACVQQGFVGVILGMIVMTDAFYELDKRGLQPGDVMLFTPDKPNVKPVIYTLTEEDNKKMLTAVAT
jgi:hypothetical protein